MSRSELREIYATFFVACPVCRARPRRLTLDRASGAVSFRRGGLVVVSGGDVCDGCTDQLSQLATETDLVSPAPVLRPNWKEVALALFV